MITQLEDIIKNQNIYNDTIDKINETIQAETKKNETLIKNIISAVNKELNNISDYLQQINLNGNLVIPILYTNNFKNEAISIINKNKLIDLSFYAKIQIHKSKQDKDSFDIIAKNIMGERPIWSNYNLAYKLSPNDEIHKTFIMIWLNAYNSFINDLSDEIKKLFEKNITNLNLQKESIIKQNEKLLKINNNL